MREPGVVDAATHTDHSRATGAGGRVRRDSCGCSRAWRSVVSPVQHAPGVLSRHRHARAVQRLRHQDRGLDAGRTLERQIPRDRQRRMGGHDLNTSARRGARSRLRGRSHRHRAYQQGWQFRLQPPGEAHRLLVSGRARNDGASQGARERLLRQGARCILLGRLLDRWPSGPERGAALSGRLRRHYRWHADELHDAHAGAEPMGRSCDAEGLRQLHPGGEVRVDPQGRAGRLRQPRRRQRRRDR